MIRLVKFVSIPVTDQDAALEFYVGKLGFSVVTDQPFDGKQRWIEMRTPKGETRVVLFNTEEDRTRIGSFMNLSFECDNVERTYEELKAKGVEFESPPKKQHWGTFVIFKDVDGNRFVMSAGGG